MIIEPLSEAHLAETIHLVHQVFPHEASTSNPPGNALKASLHVNECQELLKERGIRKLAYYMALDETTNHVLGVIGQYELDGDLPDLVWVGWFCVDPVCRGQKVGESLLRWNMQHAKAHGYTLMKLYTSDLPSEQAAQGLYQKLGFEVKQVQVVEGTGYHLLFRERSL